MPKAGNYVYSARTTEQGLVLLNKAKGDRTWDAFLNEAMAEHYKLDLADLMLPPSEFLQKREAAAKAKAKAKKPAAKKSTAKPVKKAPAKKAAKAGKPKVEGPTDADLAATEVEGEGDAGS